MAKPTVLFLDDEERIVKSLRLIFLGKYQIITATSAKDALKLLKNNKVDVIVSDQRMPEITGVEFLAQAKEISPASIRILLTGYSDLQAITDSINEGEIFRYIQKPWDNEKLLSTVQLAVEASQQSVPSTLDENDDFGDSKTEVLIIDNDSNTYNKLKGLFEENPLSFCSCHHANSLQAALKILHDHPVGVVLSDIQIDGRDIAYLLKTLKASFPQVVTIVVSDMLDAEDAINLINEGQIFRYLPQRTSTKLWKFTLQSAVKRHHELMKDPELSKRYQVEDVSEKPVDPMQRKTIASVLKGFGRKLFGIQA